MTINETVKDLLIKGGVINVGDNNTNEDETTTLATTKQNELLSRYLSMLELWIGLPDSLPLDDVDDDDDDIADMMEDHAPFSKEFYQTLESFLIQVWNPEETSQKYMNLMSESTDATNGKNSSENDQNEKQLTINLLSVSLYKSILSIRVTRLLRYWLELNVMGKENIGMDISENDDHDENNEQKTENEINADSLSVQLLKDCSFEERSKNLQNNSQVKHKFYPLIQAIYGHIEQLPYIQSQIYLYTQSLMNQGPNHTNRRGQGLANPKQRLEYLQSTQQLTTKLNQEFDNHISDLEYIVGEWYSIGNVDIRRQCRGHLGSIWSLFEQRTSGTGGTAGGGFSIGSGMKVENTSSSGIDMTLRLLHRILLGIQQPSDDNVKLMKSYEHLLFHHLIPLHRPNSMVLWRDQTSLLELYHEPLVQCIAVLLQKQPEWTGRVIGGLLEPDVWSKGGNTPKLVLLLHEIDTYISCLPDPIQGDELGDTYTTLLRTLGTCMASENSRLAQRALPYVKNKKFVQLLGKNFDTGLDILLPFLLRKEPSWNPTVRKMTYNVLKTLQDLDEQKFIKMGDSYLSNQQPHITDLPTPHQNPVSSPPTELASEENNDQQQKKGIVHESDSDEAMLPADYTLKSAMGNWKPPSNKKSSRSSGPRTGRMPPPMSRPPSAGGLNPPLGVTGVASWAMNGPQNGASSGKNPPLGVTGVAPWAMNQQKQSPSHHQQRKGTLPGLKEEATKSEEDEKDIEEDSTPTGVVAYMKKIKPREEDKGASSWSKAQMAETPTLLPTLKFHDLVFGHDLGKGSFGSVRYARLIDRSTTRSNWAEYAVKIISTERIKEMGYEASVQREMAVLRILSHPCIARLVSSFRFHDGVYLVLEYASKGDVHSLLKNNGSLDHDSARFVIGEVISALSSIHELGLVYADLKPENVVITETGHLKLTDFGGSRPITDAAKAMISESAQNMLAELRDGDWKSEKKKKRDFEMDDDDDDEHSRRFDEYDPEADLRIEGTTMYLPPEVIMGAFPSPAADSWALGCVLYQCLTGRPPIIEDDEALTKNRIVSFDARGANDDGDENHLFREKHASNVEGPARDLIVRLLNRQANERPTMNQAAEHHFFQDAGIDVFSLHQKAAHPLDCGTVAPPAADAKWSRRQLSSIWAPQPQSYDISLDYKAIESRSTGRKTLGPISEGAEAPSFFSKSTILPSIRSATQGVPLPPQTK